MTNITCFTWTFHPLFSDIKFGIGNLRNESVPLISFPSHYLMKSNLSNKFATRQVFAVFLSRNAPLLPNSTWSHIWNVKAKSVWSRAYSIFIFYLMVLFARIHWACRKPHWNWTLSFKDVSYCKHNQKPRILFPSLQLKLVVHTSNWIGFSHHIWCWDCNCAS